MREKMGDAKPKQFFLECRPFPETLEEQKKWLADRRNFMFFNNGLQYLLPGSKRLEAIIGDVTRLNQATIMKFYKKSCDNLAILDASKDADEPSTMERWRVAQYAAELICKASSVAWRSEMKEWLDNALLRYGLKAIPKYRDARAQDQASGTASGTAPASAPTPTSASAPKNTLIHVTTIRSESTLEYTLPENGHGAEAGKERGLKEYQNEVQTLMKDIEDLAGREERLEDLRRKKLRELAGVNAEMAEFSISKKIKCDAVTELMRVFCKERTH